MHYSKNNKHAHATKKPEFFTKKKPEFYNKKQQKTRVFSKKPVFFSKEKNVKKPVIFRKKKPVKINVKTRKNVFTTTTFTLVLKQVPFYQYFLSNVFQ